MKTTCRCLPCFALAVILMSVLAIDASRGQTEGGAPTPGESKGDNVAELTRAIKDEALPRGERVGQILTLGKLEDPQIYSVLLSNIAMYLPRDLVVNLGDLEDTLPCFMALKRHGKAVVPAVLEHLWHPLSDDEQTLIARLLEASLGKDATASLLKNRQNEVEIYARNLSRITELVSVQESTARPDSNKSQSVPNPDSAEPK